MRCGDPRPGKNPSPMRPARRAAASVWPPMMIGTGDWTGLGNAGDAVTGRLAIHASVGPGSPSLPPMARWWSLRASA